MDSIVLDELAFKPDCDQMIKKMHLRERRPETNRFRVMVEEAQKLAQPKALYKISKIQSRGPTSVVIDSQELESRVLRVKVSPEEIAMVRI